MSNSGAIDPAAAAERAGVRIRAAEPDDVDAIGATLMDPGVYPGTLQVPYTSMAQYRERFSFTDPHVRVLVAVPLSGDDQPVGNIGLHRATNPRRIHTATLGMGISSAWQGRGVGSALMAAALDVADRHQ